jgi:2-oxoglutarate ferredoxin oxidoreductase subunit alpha
MTTKGQGEEFSPYSLAECEDGCLVPPMTTVGRGHFPHVTGLTHDDRGYPAMNAAAQATLMTRLTEKIRSNADQIIEIEEDCTDGADVVVISYGITARVCQPAIERARKEGLQVGFLRLITVWPFPEKRIRELATRVKAFVVAEMNLGQMVREVQRHVGRDTKVGFAGNAGGTVLDPDAIYDAIREVSR